jgi:RimJ/RimL family protein N-acetyltransferase
VTDQLDHQPEIAFRSLSYADFGMLHAWLRAPHVQAWWGEPLDAARIEAEYGPCIAGTDPTRIFIIVAAGRPVGLIQHYRNGDYPDWDRTVAVPQSASIDYLIGEPDACGRGIGSRAIARFSEIVFAAYTDLDTIVATPQYANRASCRALEKATYTLVEVRQLDSDDPTDAGPSAIYVLHPRAEASDGAERRR